jgi:ferritin-like metal-binding protein YciE|tara:strand:- start:349 stop:555 length:207 start_codon:yes stop_codon:yes gene_type:complete
MGVQNKILKLQEQVEILGGALTKAFKKVEALETLTQGTLTAFQLHIGKEDWDKVVEELKDLDKRNVEQ